MISTDGFNHISVLLQETIDALEIKPDGIYVDGTVGGAGHAAEIADRLSGGMLIALDRDPDAVAVAAERLKDKRAKVIKSNFDAVRSVLADIGVDGIDGMLLDLGVSSWQLDSAERGFSYHNDAPLDMRMSREGQSAADLINTLNADELCDIFTKYGEEKFAYRIANRIIDERENGRIGTTARLADIIRAAYPASARRDGHPARKCFQALRIAVNGELDSLEKGLDEAFSILKPGGKLAVITFHSLEDRIVKQKFAALCKGCECPPDIPVCVCGKKPQGVLAPKKPVLPTEQEIKDNPRSRSAKLRAIRKL